MKARPILLNGDMVRAVIAGNKTQTRRMVKSPAKNMQRMGQKVIDHRPAGDKWYRDHVWSMRGDSGTWHDYTHDQFMALSPYGAVGDLLYVRETFGGPLIEEGTSPDYYYLPEFCEYRADGGPTPEWNDSDGEERSGWTPSIHMPRWASRITLEIVSVRVERVQDISEEDAMAEGAAAELVPPDGGSMPHVQGFSSIWNSIYSNWDENPWVWVIEFKVHMMNVDQFIRESSNDKAS